LAPPTATAAKNIKKFQPSNQHNKNRQRTSRLPPRWRVRVGVGVGVARRWATYREALAFRHDFGRPHPLDDGQIGLFSGSLGRRSSWWRWLRLARTHG
jgi:hypothetical protein